MEQSGRKRAGELLRQTFEVLMSHPAGLPVAELLQRVGESPSLTDRERSRDLYHGMRPFEEIILLSAIPMVGAGWLEDKKGRWSVTEQGKTALAELQDPSTFLSEAARRSVKGWLVVHTPKIYLFVTRIKAQWHIELQMVRRNGAGRILNAFLGITAAWQKTLPIQTPRRFKIRGLPLNNFDDLARYLEASGLTHDNAGHTFYLPPDA